MLITIYAQILASEPMDCVSMLNMKLSQNVMEQMVYNGAEEIDISAVVSDLHVRLIAKHLSLPPNHPGKKLIFHY